MWIPNFFIVIVLGRDARTSSKPITYVHIYILTSQINLQETNNHVQYNTFITKIFKKKRSFKT